MMTTTSPRLLRSQTEQHEHVQWKIVEQQPINDKRNERSCSETYSSSIAVLREVQQTSLSFIRTYSTVRK